MKKICQIVVFTLLGSFINFFSKAQFPYGDVWYSATQQQLGPQGATSFVIGNKVYILSGSLRPWLWEYDPANDTWTQKADSPVSFVWAVSFTINGKAYVGSGRTNSDFASADFWEYDPAINIWTQKANIPVARRQAVGFSIGNKGYIGTGIAISNLLLNDFWEYNPVTDSWTQKANFPGAARAAAAGFSVNNKGYIGTGIATSNVYLNDFWEYNPVTDTWTQKANFPGAVRNFAVGFSGSGKGYIGTGINSGTTYRDVYEYNPTLNSWNLKTQSSPRSQGIGFMYGGRIYLGYGMYNGWFSYDLIRYSPYYEVRNSTGDYDEYLEYGNDQRYPSCYMYDLSYAGNWSAYIEVKNTGSYAGLQVRTGENLGNICYRSRVDADASLRGGFGWYGGTSQENVLFCRRNYQVSFQNQPSSSVGVQLYYTKAELDALINGFNSAYGTNKNYSDLRIIKYNGINQDLDPTNNSNNREDYEQIIPSINSYGDQSQFLYAEFNVSSFSEFYLGLTRSKNLFVNDGVQSGDVFTTAVGNNSNPGTASAPFATLDYAVNMAQPGDTIFVDAGDYSITNLTINKPLTLLGSNYAINPNDLNNPALENSNRNAEATILDTWITVASDNVTIEGFTMIQESGLGIKMDNTNWGHLKVQHNKFIVSLSRNWTRNAIDIRGVTTPPIVQSDFKIIDNRFIKTDTFPGANVNMYSVRNVIITGNSMVSTLNASQVKQSGIYLGIGNLSYPNSGFVDTAFIANNFIDGLGSSIRVPRLSNAQIINNTILNSGSGIICFYNTYDISNVTVSNNKLENIVALPLIFRGQSNKGFVKNLVIDGNIINQDVIEFEKLNNGLNFSLITVDLRNGTGIHGPVSIVNNKINIFGVYGNSLAKTVNGIRIGGQHTTCAITGNELSYTAIGYQPSVYTSEPAVPTGISIVNSSTNLLPGDAKIDILNNKVNGFVNSIASFDQFVASAGQDNPYGHLPQGMEVNINYNSFSNDSISINNGVLSEIMNANCNWYGTTSGSEIGEKITSATVNYSPWLTDGTDTDQATGFQPKNNVCNGTLLVVTLNHSDNLSCKDAGNGTIDIGVSGGVLPYTYVWSKQGDNGFVNPGTEDISGLHAGTYQLTVTDATGQEAGITVTVTEPDALLAQASGNNISCYGASNGSANVTVTGGNGNYTFLWSNGATGQSISNLNKGIYSVTVVDVKGCTAQASYEVTEPKKLSVVMSGTPASCNGSVTATASGGAAPYSYLWSTGSVTSTINNVPKGTYVVIVTDAHNCSVIDSLKINGSSPINPTVTVVNVSCYGLSDGSITVTGATGQGPFMYNINGSAFQGSNVFNGLSAGTYIIGAMSASGCVDYVTKTVNQPVNPLTVTLDSIRTTCFGVNKGRIYITANGGTDTKTYSWTGPNGFSSAVRNPINLYAGNYSVTVTDSKGCTGGLSTILPQSPEIVVNSSVTGVSCRGGISGAIDLTATGGSGSGFTFNWTGPNGFSSASEDLNNLPAGNYKVIITDQESGCTVQQTLSVPQPSANLNLSTSKSNASGCTSLGVITGNASGGTSPYQYSIDGSNYQSSGSFPGLYAGSYMIWTRDANGCTISKAVTITDNGKDDYEGNNTKSQAKVISINTEVNARIAVVSDVADWFMFTTGSAGEYVLNFNHPQASLFSYDIYSAGKNTAALIPVSSTSGAKTYNFSANTTYYISVTGGLSFICYQLSVNNQNVTLLTEKGRVMGEVVSDNPGADMFSVKVLGNPSSTGFILQAITASDEPVNMRVADINGRVLENRQGISAHQVIRFGNRFRSGVYFAEIRQGNNVRTVKLIKL